MKTYNYIIKFKIPNERNYLYNTSFEINASSNNDAKKIGFEKWNDLKNSKERLKNASIVKVICRKQETKPRVRKLTPLQKALLVVNDYIEKNS